MRKMAPTGFAMAPTAHLAEGAPLTAGIEVILNNLTRKPRPGSGLDCLTCSTFARPQLADHEPVYLTECIY